MSKGTISVTKLSAQVRVLVLVELEAGKQVKGITGGLIVLFHVLSPEQLENVRFLSCVCMGPVVG